MAAPTLSAYTWNPVALTLTITGSAALYAGSTFAAGNIDLTDANGRRYENTNQFSGSATTTVVVNMALSSGSAETASTVDIAAGTFMNVGTEDQAAVTDAAIYTKVNHVAPFNRYDLNRLAVIVTAVAGGTLDATAGAANADLTTYSSTAFAAALAAVPLAMTQAQALLAAYDKWILSSKDAPANALLAAAIRDLRVAMPAAGTFAITPVGT